MPPECRKDTACGALAVAALVALQALGTAPAAAQSPRQQEADPWYRVEILVFRQPGEAGLTAEAWEPDPELAYPRQHRHLVDRALADARHQAFPGSHSRVDSLGRQQLRLPRPRRSENPPLEALTDVSPLAEDIPGPPLSPDADTTTIMPEPVPVDPPRADARLDADNPDVPLPPPAAYTLLPERLRELNRDAARMRSAGYDILLHAAWVQPVVGEDSARAIILDRSGDPDIGGWPVLQGSLTLHLSRYLHVSTRLWLNTSGDYLHPQWRMAEPPRAPASLTLALPTPDQGQWPRVGEPGDHAPEVTRPDGLVAPAHSLPAPGFQDNAPSGDDAHTDYPWRHAIPLAQSRRMRGGELHYLDHPVLGVLIKMTRLEDDDARELYRETRDWAWEDRHNVVLVDRETITLPPGNRP